MIADPPTTDGCGCAGEDVGERSCKHWHSRPRWGLLGMIARLVAGQALLRLSLSLRGVLTARPAPNKSGDGFVEVA